MNHRVFLEAVVHTNEELMIAGRRSALDDACAPADFGLMPIARVGVLSILR
jgi:hypothetical protein